MPEMMQSMDIAFPHLGIYLHHVPKTFSIFGFPIVFYGVIIGCGMLLGVFLAARMAKVMGVQEDHVWDAALWLIVCSVIGARLYYVAFSWDLYREDPISILYIRNGGLAIYGGVIAGFTTLAVYVKMKKENYFRFADTLVFGLVCGQIIGRWGNFTNREAFGDYTNSLFAMRLPMEMVRQNEITAKIAAHIAAGSNYIQVHPTFLYESLWNLMLLCLMLFYVRHRKFDGEMMLFYLGGYGIGRFFIEQLRTDQLRLPGTRIAVSQFLGLFVFVCSLLADLYLRRKKKSEYSVKS